METLRDAIGMEILSSYALHLQEGDPGNPPDDFIKGFRTARKVIGEQLARMLELIDSLPQ